MAITVTKAKETAKKEEQQLDVVDVTQLDIDDLADRYGMLEDKVTAVMHNPVFAQFDEVKKELTARLAEVDAESTVEIKGKHWLLECSMAKKNPRKLLDGAVDKLIAFLGIQTFAKIAKVNISDCEKYLTPDQVAEVIDEDTGYSKNRTIKSNYLG